MTSEEEWVLHGGKIVSPQGVSKADLHIKAGKVVSLGENLTLNPKLPLVSAEGFLVFPGLVDPQVHFREPGLEWKEDLASGSLAAVAGGVTSFMEMPNTKPPTTDPRALEDKLKRARGRCYADHSFFLGATGENAENLGEWEQTPGCAGIKVFMGSSTGNLLIEDDATLERVLRSGERRVAVHSEDEPRLKERYAKVKPGSPHRIHPEVRDVEAALKATKRLLHLVEKTGRRVHLLHVSTAEECDLLRERDLGNLVTAEVTPNHLFLQAPGCYEDWASLVQMNPPIRERRHLETIRQALVDGVIACIGSDHAPHLLEEKKKPYPLCPSGIPGVQTILPLMLMAVREGWLDYPKIAKITSQAPSRVYGVESKGSLLPGMDADFVLVDPGFIRPLEQSWVRSRAGYSPYAGMLTHGFPIQTYLRGKLVFDYNKGAQEVMGAPLTYK
jgi:dihydroorotase